MAATGGEEEEEEEVRRVEGMGGPPSRAAMVLAAKACALAHGALGLCFPFSFLHFHRRFFWGFFFCKLPLFSFLCAVMISLFFSTLSFAVSPPSLLRPLRMTIRGGVGLQGEKGKREGVAGGGKEKRRKKTHKLCALSLLPLLPSGQVRL